MKNTNINTEAKAETKERSLAEKFLCAFGSIMLVIVLLNISTGISNNDVFGEFTVRHLIIDHIFRAIVASLVTFKPWRLLIPHKAA